MANYFNSSLKTKRCWILEEGTKKRRNETEVEQGKTKEKKNFFSKAGDLVTIVLVSTFCHPPAFTIGVL